MKIRTLISPVCRLLTVCIASLLIAIILLKPHAGFLIDEDLETIQMSSQVDENDFEEDPIVEFDPDFFKLEICDQIALASDQETDFSLTQHPVTSIYSDIFLPPPEL